MKTRKLVAIALGAAASLSLGASPASAQQTSRDSSRVTSSIRIPVRKDVTRAESAGDVARDSAARADSIAREMMLAAERARQDSLAALERARQDSLAMIERARQDSIARAEAIARARADSIARADSLARVLAMRRKLPSSMYFNIAGGASVPQGMLNDLFKTGWNGTASLGWHPVNLPFGVRIDGTYDRFGGRTVQTNCDCANPTLTFEDASVWSGLAEATVKIPRLLGVSPYLVGGGGIYHFSNFYTGFDLVNGTAGSKSSTTKGGWNAGGGIAFNFGRSALFVESRYMRVATPNDESKFVPIILGLTFR